MARKCPDCGYMNDDEMAFCADCGEPLDPQVRLIRDLENSSKTPSGADRQSRAARDDDDDDDYVAPTYHGDNEEKKSPLGWIIGLLVAAAAIYFLFLR